MNKMKTFKRRFSLSVPRTETIEESLAEFTEQFNQLNNRKNEGKDPVGYVPNIEVVATGTEVVQIHQCSTTSYGLGSVACLVVKVEHLECAAVESRKLVVKSGKCQKQKHKYFLTFSILEKGRFCLQGFPMFPVRISCAECALCWFA